MLPSYTGALCKYRKILFHLGSTRSLRHCKGRLVHSTLNPRGRTVDSHAPRSFRRRQQKVLGYLTPRGNPNIVGNRLLIEHCAGTQDAKRPSPFCSREEEGDSRCASNLPSGGIGGTPATMMTSRWSVGRNGSDIMWGWTLSPNTWVHAQKEEPPSPQTVLTIPPSRSNV